MHSATKYLGGHSDALGGAVVVRDQELYDRLYFIQNSTGAVMGPLESFLMSRGLKTLELRVREQSRTAQRLAEYLDADPRIQRVLYPGLQAHPEHDIAAKQMDSGFGAMLSFEVAGDFEKTKRVVESNQVVSTSGQSWCGRVANRTACGDVACELRRRRQAVTRDSG